jgi:hypothetical protein
LINASAIGAYTGVFTIKQPLTINGFIGGPSSWSGGQLVQTNDPLSQWGPASLTINGSSFEWAGGTLNAPPSSDNDIYVTGGAQFGMSLNASICGDNISLGNFQGGTTATLRIGAPLRNFGLTGNVSMANGSVIAVYPGSTLNFSQGSNSSATVGGLTTTANQTITNYGTIIRNSPGNPAVTCGLGIGQSTRGTVQLGNQSQLNITGQYGTGGNSLQQNGDSYTILGYSAILGVSFGYYQSGGYLETATSPTQGSIASDTLNGSAEIVGGYVFPGYDATPSLHNLGTLTVNGLLTIGGTAELGFMVDGSANGRCCSLYSTQTMTVNANPSDHAYLSIDTVNQTPQSGWSYPILWALGGAGITGNNFDASQNYFYGWETEWILPTIPGTNPYRIKEP